MNSSHTPESIEKPQTWISNLRSNLIEQKFMTADEVKKLDTRTNWHNVMCHLMDTLPPSTRIETYHFAYYLTGDITMLANEEALNALPRVDGLMPEEDVQKPVEELVARALTRLEVDVEFNQLIPSMQA